MYMSGIKLGERSMYAYTVMTPRRKRRGLSLTSSSCCCCCYRCDTKRRSDDGHALKVYTDVDSEIDSTWSILLTDKAQQRMQEAGQTTVHVHLRSTRATLMHVKYGGATNTTHTLELTSGAHAARVRKLIEGCLTTAHPSEITMVDEHTRQLIVAWPLFDIHDVVVGVVWSARLAAIQGDAKMRSLDRRRAAIYYNLTDNVLVLNHQWLLNHRTSFGALLNGDEDVATVVLSSDLTVESLVHPEAASDVFANVKGKTLEELFDRRVLSVVTDTITHLTADDTTTGTAVAAVTLGPLAYQFTVTKIVGITGTLMGYVVKVQLKEQSLVANFVTTSCDSYSSRGSGSITRKPTKHVKK